MSLSFEIERQKQLGKLFTQTRLVDVWRRLVRQQLRRQAVIDLHDYYDFNSTISSAVVAGDGSIALEHVIVRVEGIVLPCQIFDE